LAIRRGRACRVIEPGTAFRLRREELPIRHHPRNHFPAYLRRQARRMRRIDERSPIAYLGRKHMANPNGSPLVAIVLINWNRYRDTLECVDSLRKSTYANIQIIVVDNGSVDESVGRLRERSSDYQLILSETNTGFTGGNNLGIERAMSIGADLIFLLNNDTLIESTAIERLVAAGQNDRSAGVVTPKIFFHPERHLLWAAGTSFDQGTLMGKNVGYRSKDAAEYSRSGYLDYAVGCALVIRREVIETVGALTEDYFANWEDVDFGLRVNRRGYKVLYEPSAIVWHKEAVAFGGMDNPQYVYYQTRSAFVFRHRWSRSFLNAVMAHSHYAAYCLLRIYRFLACGNFRSIAAVFIAIGDAIRGRLGRREYPLLVSKQRKH